MLPHKPAVFLVALLLPGWSRAEIQGPYTLDSSTLHLWHLDETSGGADPGNPLLDSVSTGAYSITNTGGFNGRDDTGAGPYGAAAYTGFGSSINALLAGNGAYHGTNSTVGGGVVGGLVAQSSLFNATSGAFTWEALINTSTMAPGNEQHLISHDGGTTRGAFLGLTNAGTIAPPGTIRFYPGVGSALDVNLPTSGPEVFVANQWYHVAVTYSGVDNVPGNLNFYWTRVDSSRTSATLLGSAQLPADLPGSVNNNLTLGGNSRTPFRFEISGMIDEVRISSVARAPTEFMFVPEPSGLVLLEMVGGLFLVYRRRRS